MAASARNRTHRHLGCSQSRLARHLQVVWLRISPGGLAKIECGMLWAGDFELIHFVGMLRVRVRYLFTNIRAEEPLSVVLTALLRHSPDALKEIAVVDAATRASITGQI